MIYRFTLRFLTSSEQVLVKAKDAKFNEAALTLTQVTGDEEKQYWINMWTEMYDKRDRQSGGKHHGGQKRQRRN